MSSIGRQITAWSISRDDWRLWRGTQVCRNLIKEYIRSGLTPMEAEVRAILFYLEFNEQTPVREKVGPEHQRVRPSSKATLHRRYQSLPYPHDPQVNMDREILMVWLTSDRRAAEITRRMPPIRPGDDVAAIRRQVEVEVDTIFDMDGLWPKWLGSVHRLNELRRRRRENENETERQSEIAVDLKFTIAYGHRPPGLVATAPRRARTKIWEKWLESEERWGEIRMSILEKGDMLQRADERADEVFEDFVDSAHSTSHLGTYTRSTQLLDQSPAPKATYGINPIELPLPPRVLLPRKLKNSLMDSTSRMSKLTARTPQERALYVRLDVLVSLVDESRCLETKLDCIQ
ncbi:hypothetical protein DL98DRAFT_591340 [Cadophora sp. DSE1049]|nr:hypothetical protein DL98DRAFT_591340 [Cadophora sp. DSE1049]